MSKYKIGELITELIQKTGMSYRQYAKKHNFSTVDLTSIRSGTILASGNRLSNFMDIEELREMLLNEIPAQLDNVSTDTLIKVYNAIYKDLKSSDDN